MTTKSDVGGYLKVVGKHFEHTKQIDCFIKMTEGKYTSSHLPFDAKMSGYRRCVIIVQQQHTDGCVKVTRIPLNQISVAMWRRRK